MQKITRFQPLTQAYKCTILAFLLVNCTNGSSSNGTDSVLPGPDVTPPIIQSSNPSSGNSGVGVATVVSVTFSEAMGVNAVNTAFTVRQTNCSGAIVSSGVPAASNGNTTFTYNLTGLSNLATYATCVATGASDSAGNTLASSYTSLWSTVAAGTNGNPVFSPVAGAYNTIQNITLTSSGTGSGITICYTTDGSTPAATSPGTCSTGIAIADNTSFNLSSSATVRAIATRAGWQNSGIATATYTIDIVAPTLVSTSPANSASGVGVATAVSVTFSEAMGVNAVNTAFTVRQTNCSGAIVSSGVPAASNGNTTFTYNLTGLSNLATYATCVATGASDSAGNTLASSYTSLWSTVAAGTNGNPVFSPVAGAYNTIQNITLTSSGTGSGITICYTTDGSTPAATSPGTCSTGIAIADNTSFNLSSSATVRAIATRAGWQNSGIATATYTIDIVAPTLVSTSPANSASGVGVATAVSVTFSEAMGVNAVNTAFTVRQTNCSGAIVSSGVPAASNGNTTFTYNLTGLSNLATYATCVATGASDSAGNTLASSYTALWSTVAVGTNGNPVFSPVAGTYMPGNVTLTSAGVGSGITICYTIDGSTPAANIVGSCSAGSALPDGTSFTLSASATVRALATRTGWNNSSVTMAVFTIDSQSPVVASVFPADGATGVVLCTGTPCKARITITFSESMNTGLTQTLTTQIWNASIYINVANTNSVFAWETTNFTNDTLNIYLSWYWFPENSQISFSLAAAGLRDVAGNTIAAPVEAVFSTGSANQAYPVSDTGQVSCFHANAFNVCGDTVNFPGQDGDYANTPNTKSFTGPTPHAVYASDFTTRDNTSGIVWQACPQGRSGSDCQTGGQFSGTWANALSQCSALNSANGNAGYSGRTNWRLPTIKELESITSHNVVNPAMDHLYFPMTYGTFWSLSTDREASNYAWTIDNTHGSATKMNHKGMNYQVRCVSSDTYNNASFTTNGDGTVTDNVANLRWQRCVRGTNNDATCSGVLSMANWQTALQYCDSLNLGAHANASNWRLPTINELKSIINRSTYSPAIDIAAFPNNPSGNQWTSTTSAGQHSDAWATYFGSGMTTVIPKSSVISVRCVSNVP